MSVSSPTASPETAQYRAAISTLRGIHANLDAHPEAQKIAQARDRVLPRFQPVFSPGHVATIEADEVREFLAFRNNEHWSGMERLAPRLCADIDTLRNALTLLIDEGQPLAGRMTAAVDMATGMAKGVSTAILHLAYPNKYGVWNNTSEAGLKTLHLWPNFERGTTIGERYLQINALLNRLAEDLGTDLWTLDALWWAASQNDETLAETGSLSASPGTLVASRFGLERHLQDFLRDNWDDTSLGHDWSLYSEPGDEEAGYEYPCDVGRIDLLARHRRSGDWLVIELKRDQASDATVGQVLRYVGWVRHHLAEGEEKVGGLIIAREIDNRLQYAVDAVAEVNLQLYEVEFHLTSPPDL